MFCVKCGKELQANARFCFYCGNKVIESGAKTEDNFSAAEDAKRKPILNNSMHDKAMAATQKPKASLSAISAQPTTKPKAAEIFSDFSVKKTKHTKKRLSGLNFYSHNHGYQVTHDPVYEGEIYFVKNHNIYKVNEINLGKAELLYRIPKSPYEFDFDFFGWQIQHSAESCVVFTNETIYSVNRKSGEVRQFKCKCNLSEDAPLPFTKPVYVYDMDVYYWSFTTLYCLSLKNGTTNVMKRVSGDTAQKDIFSGFCRNNDFYYLPRANHLYQADGKYCSAKYTYIDFENKIVFCSESIKKINTLWTFHTLCCRDLMNLMIKSKVIG